MEGPAELSVEVTERSLNAHVSSLGRRLADAFGQLVDALPGPPQKPLELARTLGVDKNAAYRLLTALRQKDPIATAHIIPGPDPLRKLVKAGRRQGLPQSVAAAAEDAIRDFDALIRQEGGDRSALDAMISAWLPDAKPRVKNVAKQLMYRGARQIKGVAADVVYFTVLFHPSDDRLHHDHVYVHGYLGFRRVCPSAQFKVGVQSHTTAPRSVELTLDGKPVTDFRGAFLEQFCSGLSIDLDVYHRGSSVIYGLKWGDAVGYNSARDIVVAGLRKKCPRRFRQMDDPRPLAGLSDAINVPARTYICDVIMHMDVYPDWEPHVKILETGEGGMADPNDPTRELDVLDVVERVEPLGSGIDRFRAAEIPRYIELLHHVCGKLGWNPEEFRGYRTRIEYPVFGSQVQYAFQLPLDPHAAREQSEHGRH